MKRLTLSACIAAALLGVAARGLSAQQQVPDSAMVDRILAVVGSKAIMMSQVQEEVFGKVEDRKEHLPDPKKDAAAFEKAMNVLLRRYTDTLIAFELLHRDAIQDTTVKVTEQEVSDAVDARLADLHKRFKTVAEFKADLRATGFATEEDYRKYLIEQQRRTLVVQRYTSALREDGKIKDKQPTAKEVRAYYDAHVDEFGQAQATVSFKQIIVAPKATLAARSKAHALADSLAIEMRKPEANFAAAAKLFSMDEGSKKDGGNLDWFPHGKMVREFEDAAFGLKPGMISDPVETPYGFHVIQVQRVQPGEVQARHILIIPDIDSAGAAAAKQTALDIVAALGRGASFDSLQHLYHDRSEDLELSNFPADSIMKTPYGAPIENVDSGKVASPFMLPVPGAMLHSKWAIVQITRRTVAGPPPFDDMKAVLKRGLAGMLGEQDYINQLRARTYVDVRTP